MYASCKGKGRQGAKETINFKGMFQKTTSGVLDHSICLGMPPNTRKTLRG